MHTATQANLTDGGQPKSDSSPKKSFMYKKEPKEPISCSGQLEPTWRGAVAGGVLIYTYFGGYIRVRIPLCTCVFVVGFWCFGAQVAARAKRRVVRGRIGGSCEFGGWPRVAYFFRFFSMRVLRFIMLGDCWGQKHGFRPRRTGRAPEWSPKREMPVLASQALATDPFPRFFQARPARKLRLTDPKCSSAATQISPTRLKPPKMAVFVTISPQRVFLRIFDRQAAIIDLKHRLRANVGCGTWLRSRIASRPKGTFLALKRAHMGTTACVLAR